jgi:hypothetical protein
MTLDELQIYRNTEKPVAFVCLLAGNAALHQVLAGEV